MELLRYMPFEACNPKGEREYLGRLRCSNGKPPKFKRRGSVGSRNPTETPWAREETLQQIINRQHIYYDGVTLFFMGKILVGSDDSAD